MATITGLTADRMLEIEGESVVSGEVRSDGNLYLTRHNGTEFNAGPVAGGPGPPGPPGPAGFGAIPGEVRLWPGSALPPQATWGKWVWADGAVYVSATYPLASSYIATQWRTFGGSSDPGVTNFRVPDLRGLAPVGMDAMPGGARANRMTRAVAITIAGRAGEETHIVTIAEVPSHAHSINDQTHNHQVNDPGHWHDPNVRGEVTQNGNWWGSNIDFADGTPGTYLGQPTASVRPTGIGLGAAYSNINGTNNNGGGGAHENVQPSVFVPYIVCLHG